ncbi:MAG: sugar phosphate isomerase/epimerase family protein [Planctomycetota bacterium]
MSAGVGVSRRGLLAGAGALAAGALSGPAAAAAGEEREPFGYCLNVATIRGQRLSIDQQAEVAAQAGYRALEPWTRDIRQYHKQGGSLGDLRKKLADLGHEVPSAIGFARWIADDETQREKALEQIRGDMDLLRRIGATGMAAPPAGARRPLDLAAAARRYRAVLELGDETGIVPQLELWGPSALHTVGQAAMVAADAGHPKALLLLDAYHIYKGGGNFAGLRLLGPHAMHAFHLNDYPDDPPREEIGDRDRVMPGDGVAPLGDILRTLRDVGFRGWLSLELFNPDYWRRPALETAKTGLAKMKAVVAAALA